MQYQKLCHIRGVRSTQTVGQNQQSLYRDRPQLCYSNAHQLAGLPNKGGHTLWIRLPTDTCCSYTYDRKS